MSRADAKRVSDNPRFALLRSRLLPSRTMRWDKARKLPPEPPAREDEDPPILNLSPKRTHGLVFILCHTEGLDAHRPAARVTRLAASGSVHRKLWLVVRGSRRRNGHVRVVPAVIPWFEPKSPSSPVSGHALVLTSS